MRGLYCIIYILTEIHVNREQGKTGGPMSFTKLLLEEVSKEDAMFPFSVRMFPFPFNKQLYS